MTFKTMKMVVLLLMKTERSITIEDNRPYWEYSLVKFKCVNGRFKCSSLTQVQNAIDGNAAGVIFTNIFRIQSLEPLANMQPGGDPSMHNYKGDRGDACGATDVITIDWSNIQAGFRPWNQCLHMRKHR